MLGNGCATPSSSAVRRRRGRPSASGGGAGGGGGRHGYWQPLPLQQQEQKRQHDRNLVVPPLTEFDRAYFRAYSHVGVHEEMIKDRVRTETYRSAITRYQHLISDKVVLDVGCGTGILAILCAFAGAKRMELDLTSANPDSTWLILSGLTDFANHVSPVYAVDASEIAVQASEVVKDNNLSDRVTVLHGRVEDVIIDEKVDVIISEWMGYMLLYESMLPSIIFSRDKWLKPGGLILPSHASLFMAPVTNTDRYRESIGFWHDVYGINMSAMVPLAKQYAFEEPTIETISGENVLTWPILVKEVDCYTVTAPELESITAKFSFSSMLQAPLHGFAFWFDVVFDGPTIQQSNHDLQPLPECHDDLHSPGTNQNKKRAKSDESIVLSTAPEDAPTHWQQTLLYLYDPIELKQDQKIEGSITLSQSKESRRFLNLHLEYSSGGRSFVKESVMR